MIRLNSDRIIATAEPIGTIRPFLGFTAPKNWLICNGAEVNTSEYPELLQFVIDNFGSNSNYSYKSYIGTLSYRQQMFGSTFFYDGTTLKLPDLRECTLVGAGFTSNNTENNSNSITEHDKYYVGQFKNDCLQNHTHSYTDFNTRYTKWSDSWVRSSIGDNTTWGTIDCRLGKSSTVTHGKQVGINWIIKVR